MPGFDHTALAAQIAADAGVILWDERPPALVAAAIRGGEGELTAHGALAVTTGVYTGRSVKDKFIVADSFTRDRVWWDNAAALGPAEFDTLLGDFLAAMRGRALYGQHLAAGADPAHRFAVTVITETAWHALFIRNLLIREPAPEGSDTVTILHLPSFVADPARHGTRSGTVIALDLRRRLVLIGGTAYAGEIKKAVFTLFNFHAPLNGVLPMHCSANVGADGDVALFFGLSGTGKTTLSNDPARPLIGDDEHGWTADGVFNLEGGCYAKTVRLSPTAEPEIFAATRRFGTVLENLVIDARHEPDYDDISLTENTRAAYALDALPAVAPGSVGGVPRTVIFLACDAFGVLPPLARLTPEQAAEHFLAGYTAKVAGTERGVTEPVATFSACFGAPFMPLHPRVYAGMLSDRLRASGAATWLVNTGWTGGGYGTGRRIDIATTRRLVGAALSGALATAPTRVDPNFGFAVPVAVAGVDARLLDPRAAWPDPSAYDAAARRLVRLFAENARRFEPAAAAAE
ncbi:MAG TPA: phosphoenolpyruvate carboxykinase (ATP) [Alphaproteobacteria bacterium]|nr:phosphoenolpyruvate carboxykinase (ATP) [Alphaproteobacteria bacterium]